MLPADPWPPAPQGRAPRRAVRTRKAVDVRALPDPSTMAKALAAGPPMRVFSDTGIAAANGDVRPVYGSLRDAVAHREIGHLWCVEQSRLERQEVGWFVLAAELAEAGVGEVHTAPGRHRAGG